MLSLSGFYTLAKLNMLWSHQRLLPVAIYMEIPPPGLLSPPTLYLGNSYSFSDLSFALLIFEESSPEHPA